MGDDGPEIVDVDGDSVWAGEGCYRRMELIPFFSFF